MRVMYIQPAEGFGGAERQGVLHISRLSQLGFQVVPVVGPGKLICTALEEQGVTEYVHLDDFFTENDKPLSFGAKVARSLHSGRTWINMQEKLLRLAQERQVDLIFANRSFGWVIASRLAHQLRVPLVWRGGSRPTKASQTFNLWWFSRLYPPDALICNCEAVRIMLAPQIKCPSYIIPNGVDTVRFDPARVRPRFREELGIDPSTPVIGLAARPAPEKGLDLLAEVMLKTIPHVPNVRLLVGGEFGWRQRYEELFARLGLADRVTFLGHVQDVECLFASCDVVVLTSRNHSVEGSPNAVLEAMSMERPIVSTRVGGLPEVIENGVQGYLVPPDDALSLSRHLVELLRDPDLRARLGAAGRRTILQRFSDGSVARRLGSVLRGVVARAAMRHLVATSPEPEARGGG